MFREIKRLLRVTDLMTPSPDRAGRPSINVKDEASNMGVFCIRRVSSLAISSLINHLKFITGTTGGI
jgi:hypothetical protein